MYERDKDKSLTTEPGVIELRCSSLKRVQAVREH